MIAEGTVLAGRFVLGPSLGGGGMGQVFRSSDPRSGRAVAIKVLRHYEANSPQARRFETEIQVLSGLSHPGIVGYVDHGTTDEGQPFLVMECLDGEDLSRRLARGPLSVADSLLVIEGAAIALREAHRRGLVHRDLKPSNLFLRGGRASDVVVLDFGIVRMVGGARGLTQTGSIVGTPEYMAPEQAQGAHDVGPTADVFALGCVLQHCLTGSSPFAAGHLIATLARIVFGEPRPLRAGCPAASEALVALVARWLARSPESRPQDAGAAVSELAALRALEGHLPLSSPPSAGLGATELELVSVIVVAPPRAARADDSNAETAVRSEGSGADALLAAMTARGAATERLVDGSIVATLGQSGSAVDQAALAVSVARAALPLWPGASIAVAMARRVAGARLPLGEALERAAALLAASEVPEVRLDEVTAALLDGRVRTIDTGSGVPVVDEAALSGDAMRPLLGRATPCVGREQELSMLEMTIAASFDESASRAALVVATAGMGKSRVRHELLRRAAQRTESTPRVLLLEARGELLRDASPYGLLSQALLRLFHVAPSDAPEVGRAKILAGVERLSPTRPPLAIAEFLGELCDVPFPDAASVQLRSARQDPRAMQARIREAFLEILRGATAEHGVLLVIEDLHWGDRASMNLVEDSLRELDDRPLCVVAFARPEIHERAPELWKGRVTLLPLRPLGRRACERLATLVAGDRLDGATLARLVAQSDGNALFLEELLRSACHGDGDSAPETVLAMLQARIRWLGTETRRVLRAASLFGERFTVEGVTEVLAASGSDDWGSRLADLVREEIVEAQRDEPGGFRFRHALMREAAYGLLTDDDRRLGHRLAAGWLAAHDADPSPIAEHFVLAGDPAGAGPWFLRAAQRAFDRDDFMACERIARRARSSGVRGESAGALGSMEGFCALTRWDWKSADAMLSEAVPLLPVGGWYWCYAQRAVAQLAAYRNDPRGLAACVASFLATAPSAEARLAYGDTAIHMASSVTQTGLPATGRALLERAEEVLGELLFRYPLVRAWFHAVQCTWIRHTHDDLARQLGFFRIAIGLYEEVGAPGLLLLFAHNALGEVECRAGQSEEGLRRIRRTYAQAIEHGAGMAISHARLALANGLLATSDPQAHNEAAQLAEQILATPGISDGYRAMALDARAGVHLAQTDYAAAEREARAAIVLSPHTPVRRWQMVARLTKALLGSGQFSEAHACAMAALREMDAAGTGGGYAEQALLLAASEAARMSGHADAASALADRNRARTARIAAAFTDPSDRARYLNHVPIEVR